jgi:hypothetical protein
MDAFSGSSERISSLRFEDEVSSPSWLAQRSNMVLCSSYTVSPRSLRVFWSAVCLPQSTRRHIGRPAPFLWSPHFVWCKILGNRPTRPLASCDSKEARRLFFAALGGVRRGRESVLQTTGSKKKALYLSFFIDYEQGRGRSKDGRGLWSTLTASCIIAGCRYRA